MTKMLVDILHVLRGIYILLESLPTRRAKGEAPLEKRRMWTKQDVLERLNMSDSTYRRHLDSGMLKPMRLNGSDLYFEEDIEEAMEESRRKGRL